VKNGEISVILRRTAGILLWVFICIDAVIGFYHLTHGGGWVSGSTEILFAVLAGTAGYLAMWNSNQNRKRPGCRRLAGLFILSVEALVILILSIYHFTHNGLPSGIIEAVMTSMLISIIVLIRKSTIKQSH
jgi:hypothetical protein